MARLMKCPDCGGIVSSRAPSCPHCGAVDWLTPGDLRAPKRRGCIGGTLRLALLAFVLLVIVAVVVNRGKRPAERTAAPAERAAVAAGSQSPAEAEPDSLIDGLSLAKRKEIYAVLSRGQGAATKEAESRYPFSGIPIDKAASSAYLKRRKAFYDAEVKKLRVRVVRDFKVDGDVIDRIDTEGTEKRWPY